MSGNKILAIGIFILCIFSVSYISFAAVINVPADQATIQAGIDAANNGDTVLVAEGIYTGDGNVNVNFNGKQITVKSRNGAKATIIDCKNWAATRGFTFNNNETNDSVLDGFTIKNGFHELGGGIYINDASPTIQNCVITLNRAVAKNSKSDGGGGIYCFNSDAIITTSKIIDNSANSKHGGGVLLTGFTNNFSSQPSLIDCIITKNNGDGVFCYDDVNPVIDDCTITQNSGRGIVYNSFARGKNPISNCRIEKNSSGGVECSNYSRIEIIECLISQNTAKLGGGIYCDGSSIIGVYESIISRNIATQDGGGIYIFSKWGHAEISNCTISQNTANANGGGIYAYIEFSFFTLSNSIVWGNNANGKRDEFAGIGRIITVRSCDIRNGLEGIGIQPDGQWFKYENNIDADPQFVDADRGDFRLKLNSPASGMGPQTNVGGALNVAPVGKRLVKWAKIKRE